MSGVDIKTRAVAIYTLGKNLYMRIYLSIYMQSLPVKILPLILAQAPFLRAKRMSTCEEIEDNPQEI